MVKNGTHRVKINRELKTEERELIRNLLSHLPDPHPYVEQLDSLHVVGQCDCGCPTIDLALVNDKTHRSKQVPETLIEADARSPEGIAVGVILWAKGGRISELEVFAWEDRKRFGLPDLASIMNYCNRENAV